MAERALFAIAALLTLGASAQVTPAAATLTAGQKQQFTATCAVPGCSIHDWSIDSPTSLWTCSGQESNAGAIDQTGLYTAPAAIATAQTVHLNVSLGDSFAGCSATITLQPSAPPPPPPPPPPAAAVINPVPWMLGWPFVWTVNGNGLLLLAADRTLIPAIQTNLPALGSACSGLQLSDAVTELRVCVGGKWRAIAVQ